MQGSAPNRGLHVLVVGSEAFIGLHLKELLASAGHTVIGPFSDPKQALAAVTDGYAVDLAILDVTIEEQAGFALPAELNRQNIPFLYVTAAAEKVIPGEYRDNPALQKPFATTDVPPLIEALRSRKRI
jgi:DNA-binding response OmpR family regulator